VLLRATVAWWQFGEGVDMDSEIRVQLAEEGADAERLDSLTGYLREELLQLDVEDVTTLRAGPPPPGSRALDAAVAGGLLVTVGRSAAGLRTVVSAVRRWLARGDRNRRVRLEIGGDALELSHATAEDQEKLISVFLARHG
jgi:hypothetical protein